MGNPISKEAAEHMASFRVRCSNCTKNFCTVCNRTPYHVGKTCKDAEKNENARKCRFCLEVIKGVTPPSMVQAFKNVCRKPDCLNEMNSSCAKMHACGHPCGGFANEKECLPCLEPDCIIKFNSSVESKKKISDGHTNSDYCVICYSQGIGDKPSVQLGCRHIFHVDCIMKILKQRWLSPRIVFAFANCPQCKVKIEALLCPAINDEMEKINAFEIEVKKKALERAKYEGIDKDDRLVLKGDFYYNNI